jgi:hypoxanthine phosphoribosyltransferase
MTMSESDVDTATGPYARVDVLITEEQIAQRVRVMGAQLSAEYAGKKPLLIAVLKGGAVFLTDLIRRMDIELEIDFLSLSSYGNATTSSGKVHLVHDLRANLDGRHVVLVEGVVDTGHSVRFLLDLLSQRNPASLKVCTLLDKVPCRRVPVPVDFVGFPIGDEFVIGYGMDAAEGLRQLPYVGVAFPNAPRTEPAK